MPNRELLSREELREHRSERESCREEPQGAVCVVRGRREGAREAFSSDRSVVQRESSMNRRRHRFVGVAPSEESISASTATASILVLLQLSTLFLLPPSSSFTLLLNPAWLGTFHESVPT